MAFGLFLAVTVVAALQPLRPDPLSSPQDWIDWLWYPIETNAPWRLPDIAADLNDLAVQPGPDGTAWLWAVGDGEAIVHSRDGGHCWIGQGDAAPVRHDDWERERVCGPRTVWDLLRPAAGDTTSAPALAGPAVPGSVANKPHLIALRFRDASTGYAVGANGLILSTKDSGNVWVRQTSGSTATLHAVWFADGDTGWAAGSGGTILRTQDGGKHWAGQRSGTAETLNALWFQDARVGWAAGSSGTILRTVDGGGQWAPQTSGTAETLNALWFKDAKVGWAAGASGTILRSDDGGGNWAPQTSGTSEALNALAFLDDGRRGWAVGARGTLVSTTDGGTWTAAPPMQGPPLRAVRFLRRTGEGWAVGSQGTVLHTPDGGAHWYPATTGPAERFNAVHFRDARRGWLAAGWGAILATSDGGTTWTPKPSGTHATLHALAFADDRVGWAVGEAGTVLATGDGGETWERRANGELTQTLYDIRVRYGTGWAVGEQGRLVQLRAATDRVQGQDLVTIPSQTDRTLYELNLSHSDATGWAVGARGTLLRLDFVASAPKSEYQSLDSITDLYSLALAGPQDGWAVGKNGIVLRLDKGVWKVQSSASDQAATLSAVRLRNDGTPWAVGQNGTILSNWERKDPPQTTDDLAALEFDGSKGGWIAGRHRTLLKTEDGGRNWTAPVRYRAWPAPWWYFCCVVSLLILWNWGRWPRRSFQAGIADRLMSDRPLRPGEPDALGLNDIAGGLAALIQNPDTGVPLTIAVTGGWGTGKTSQMDLLREELKTKGYRSVTFNAWHHQQGEPILASLFASIAKGSIPSRLTIDGLEFQFRLALTRMRRHPVWSFLLILLFPVACGLIIEVWFYWNAVPDPIAQLKGNKTISIALGAIGAIGTLVPPVALWQASKGFLLKPRRLLLLTSPADRPTGFDRGARVRFLRELEDVTKSLKPRRLVIFIDDLDRCTPDTLMEVLETVNMLATGSESIIVMGMDEQRVKECVEEHRAKLFATLAKSAPAPLASGPSRNHPWSADDYLQKLINVRTPVPLLDRTKTEELVKSLLSATPQAKAPGNARRLPEWVRRSARTVAHKINAHGKDLLFLAFFLAAIVIGLHVAPTLRTEVQSRLANQQSVQSSPCSPEPSQPSNTPRQEKPEPEQPTPPAPAFDLRAGPLSLLDERAWVSFAASVIWLYLLARNLRRNRRDRETTDSEQFRIALCLWTGSWLYWWLQTPRACKSFLNKLRYAAARLRNDPEKYPEHHTVALAAIHVVNADWLDDAEAFKELGAGQTPKSVAGGSPAWRTLKPEEVDRRITALTKLIEDHKAQAKKQNLPDWPTDEHREQFLKVIGEAQ